MNADKHVLNDIKWDFFCTFTLSREVSSVFLTKMFFAEMRRLAANVGVHFSRLQWALRFELGEINGRLHCHALIAGLPSSWVQVATCFSVMRSWEKQRNGGMARVRVFNSALAGADYVLDGVDEAYGFNGGNWYELGKLGGRCSVMLSMSLIRFMQNRQRFGHRARGGSNESRGTDAPATTLQRVVGDVVLGN